MLMQRFPRAKTFIDSDKLVSLQELRARAKTVDVVLILTPGCFTQGCVAAEIVTCQ